MKTFIQFLEGVKEYIDLKNDAFSEGLKLELEEDISFKDQISKAVKKLIKRFSSWKRDYCVKKTESKIDNVNSIQIFGLYPHHLIQIKENNFQNYVHYISGRVLVLEPPKSKSANRLIGQTSTQKMSSGTWDTCCPNRKSELSRSWTSRCCSRSRLKGTSVSQN